MFILYWYSRRLEIFHTRAELWRYAVARGLTEAGGTEFLLRPGYRVVEEEG